MRWSSYHHPVFLEWHQYHSLVFLNLHVQCQPMALHGSHTTEYAPSLWLLHYQSCMFQHSVASKNSSFDLFDESVDLVDGTSTCEISTISRSCIGSFWLEFVLLSSSSVILRPCLFLLFLWTVCVVGLPEKTIQDNYIASEYHVVISVFLLVAV